MDDLDFLDEPFKTAQPTRGSGSLDTKLRQLLPIVLTDLKMHGRCDLDAQEAAHPEISGRWRLTCSAGVGGKRGLKLIRQGALVFAFQDNVRNLAGRLKELDPEALKGWMVSVGLTPETCAEWVRGLPRA
jgi:hypothetical protein